MWGLGCGRRAKMGINPDCMEVLSEEFARMRERAHLAPKSSASQRLRLRTPVFGLRCRALAHQG